VRARRLALVLSSLGPGGTERQVTLLARHLAARGHAVSVITLSDASGDFYALDASVRRIALGLTGTSSGVLAALRANGRRVQTLRTALRSTQAELALAFLAPIAALVHLAARAERIPFLASERNDPRCAGETATWRLLSKLAFRRAELVVANRADVARWLAEELGHARVAYVPNLVEEGTTRADLGLPRPLCLCVARLVPHKGVERVIASFEQLARPEWTLAIAGDGPERERLARLAGPRVRFLGWVRERAALYAGADLFALASRHEGMSNALLESMSAGVPAVALESAAGELVVDGESGLVAADDDASWTRALARALDDAELRARLARGARRAAQRYLPEHVVPRWEAAIERALER
jgi:glycosyltransferase involved in cell wall biosynthesis